MQTRRGLEPRLLAGAGRLSPVCRGVRLRPRRGGGPGIGLHLDLHLAAGPLDGGMVALRRGADRTTEVAQHVPAVSDLDSPRRALAGTVGIGAGAVAGDHLDARVGPEPGSQRLGRAVRQQVENPIPFKVDEHRPVAMTGRQATSSTPSTRTAGPGSRGPWSRRVIRSNVSAPAGMASRCASRAPASPPRATPRCCWSSPSRSVRRAATGAVPTRRSAKVWRAQYASWCPPKEGVDRLLPGPVTSR